MRPRLGTPYRVRLTFLSSLLQVDPSPTCAAYAQPRGTHVHGFFAHENPPPLQDRRRTTGIGLLEGFRRESVFMSEVPMYERSECATSSHRCNKDQHRTPVCR